MARYSTTLRDQNLAPIDGAYVSVTNTWTNEAAVLTDDYGQPLDNPFVTGEYGDVIYNTSAGQYRNSYSYGGREIFAEVVPVGVLILNVQPDPAHAGEFVALDADGNATYSAGTGADAGLRTDIAASTGAALVGITGGGSIQSWINSIIGSAGSALVGFLQAGTGAVARTVQSKLRDVASVKDFGAIGDGVVNDNAAIASALAASNDIFFPAGTYKITSTMTLDAYQVVRGAGLNNTTIVIAADAPAFVMQEWSRLDGLKVVKSGSHTKNLIEIGSADKSLDGGRATISNVWAEGAGLDGIHLFNGNLGLLDNVVSILNGRDGVHFDTVSGDLNAWSSSGYLDLRNNIRDGLHLANAGSETDNSKANQFYGVVSQTNGRYDIYCNTRSNVILAYAEAGGTAEVYLDTLARGNYLVTTQGNTTDNSADKSFNTILSFNATAGYQRIFQNRQLFSGMAEAGLEIFNDDGNPGTVRLAKTGARAYGLITDDSSGLHAFTFGAADGPTNWQFTGNTFPTTDNVFELGGASKRWSVVYAGTGTINTSDEREKQWDGVLTPAHLAAAKRIAAEIGQYRFLDAIERKGPDGARIHIGVRAQKIAEIMIDEGLEDLPTEGGHPSFRHGFLCYNGWEAAEEVPAGDRYGIRPDELALFLIAAQEARLKALEA